MRVKTSRPEGGASRSLTRAAASERMGIYRSVDGPRAATIARVFTRAVRPSGEPAYDSLVRQSQGEPVAVRLEHPTMDFHQDHVVPYLVHLLMRQSRLTEYRRQVIPAARGRVLEIGIGSGMNLPLYTKDVSHVIGLDPSLKLLSIADRSANGLVPNVELIERTTEAQPLRGQEHRHRCNHVDALLHS